MKTGFGPKCNSRSEPVVGERCRSKRVSPSFFSEVHPVAHSHTDDDRSDDRSDYHTKRDDVVHCHGCGSDGGCGQQQDQSTVSSRFVPRPLCPLHFPADERRIGRPRSMKSSMWPRLQWPRVTSWVIRHEGEDHGQVRRWPEKSRHGVPSASKAKPRI